MRTPVAIDSNLLLLLIVGSASLTYIEKHRRLSRDYGAHQYESLLLALNEFSDIILLPNTLTEVSNLLRQDKSEPMRSEVILRMKALVLAETERFVPCRTVMGRPEFVRLGLADAALLELATAGLGGAPVTLLTADRRLAAEAEALGCAVVDFNHLR